MCNNKFCRQNLSTALLSELFPFERTIFNIVLNVTRVAMKLSTLHTWPKTKNRRFRCQLFHGSATRFYNNHTNLRQSKTFQVFIYYSRRYATNHDEAIQSAHSTDLDSSELLHIGNSSYLAFIWNTATVDQLAVLATGNGGTGLNVNASYVVFSILQSSIPSPAYILAYCLEGKKCASNHIKAIQL